MPHNTSRGGHGPRCEVRTEVCMLQCAVWCVLCFVCGACFAVRWSVVWAVLSGVSVCSSNGDSSGWLSGGSKGLLGAARARNGSKCSPGQRLCSNFSVPLPPPHPPSNKTPTPNPQNKYSTPQISNRPPKGSFQQLSTTGGWGGVPTPPTPPPWTQSTPILLKDWAKFSSGPLADQKSSLAPSAPITPSNKFFFSPLTPLKTQHHWGLLGVGGWGGWTHPTPHHHPEKETCHTPHDGIYKRKRTCSFFDVMWT